jgi:signal transduction histidine kinase
LLEPLTGVTISEAFCGSAEGESGIYVGTGEGAEVTPWSSACGGELVERAIAIALGVRRRRHGLGLPQELARRIDRSEGRAVALAAAGGGGEEGQRVAAVEFVAEALTTLLLEKAIAPGEAEEIVSSIAAGTGHSFESVTLAVFLRASSGHDVAQLPPALAMDLVLNLLVELAPADAVSVWANDSNGRFVCLASAGDAPESRRLRVAARTQFAGVAHDSPRVHSALVQRWDAPFAAVAARGWPEAGERLAVFLREAAAALSPLLERSMLFEQSGARERLLVSATERRLVRLGFDLHDGPMQEIVALAADMRQARAELASIVDGQARCLLEGRFDDFEARLAELDGGMREIAHSVRSTSAVEQPLEHALRKELDALERAGRVTVELDVEGDVTSLTASQKIALFRVAQESLSNVGKHSDATHVRIHVRSVRGHVTISITDDGRGFDTTNAGRGRLGLAGISERVRLLGGDVLIKSRPGAGVRVEATVPRWRPADAETAPVYAVTA